jgi:hypothetical protein
LLEEAHPVERDTEQRGDRLEDAQLVLAEERCVRRRPHQHRRAGLVEAHRLLAVGRPRLLGEQLAVHVEDGSGLRPDEVGGRPEHALGDLGPRRRERHEAADRLLETELLVLAPLRPNGLRRVEAEQERDAGDDREQLHDRGTGRALVGRERGADDRDGQRGRCEGEHAHPIPRDGRLLPSRPPETHGHDDREHRPVDEERDHVDQEPGRARLVGRRQLR